MPSKTADAERLEEERQWVEKAQSGETNALRPIFERYANALYSAVLLPRLLDPTAAEDVLRETFLVAVEKIRSFVWSGTSIYAWIRKIAVNKVIDLQRRAQRSHRLVKALALETPTESERSDGADERFIQEEQRQAHGTRIQSTLAKLSERYQRAIELRLVQELTRDECAAALGVKLGHFDVLFYRAVRSFRREFGERNEDG